MDDVGFELGGDGGGAEPTVQQPDGIGLVLEDLDNRGVDVAGAGDPAQQLRLAWSRAGSRAWAGLAAGCPAATAEADAGVIGHAEPVGDPGEDRQW